MPKQKHSNNMTFDFGDDHKDHLKNIDAHLKDNDQSAFRKTWIKFLRKDNKNMGDIAGILKCGDVHIVDSLIEYPDKLTWEELWELTVYYYKRGFLERLDQMFLLFRSSYIGYKWYKDYKEYLNSKEWKFLRRLVLYRDFHKCTKCCNVATEVHHHQYPKLWCDDRLEYLYSICSECHRKKHLDRGLTADEVFFVVRPKVKL